MPPLVHLTHVHKRGLISSYHKGETPVCQGWRLELPHEACRGAILRFWWRRVYQLTRPQFVYALELLFSATVLAPVPYPLLRGPSIASRALFLTAA